MKAIVWHGKENLDFSYEEVDDPKIRPDQILVEVKAAAVCGSDSHLKDFDAAAPLIPGHEVAGIVIESGKEVQTMSVGDRVAMDPVQKCGTCYSCTHGIENLCENYRHLGDGLTPGGFAELMPVDAANAYRIPDGVPFETACLMEPAAVCCQSLQRAALRSDDNVLILGDGPFGFLHAMAARGMGVGRMLVAGHYDQRLQRIQEATGAVTCNTHTENLDDAIASVLEGAPGFDVVIEATGAGPVPNIGIRALRPQGTMVLFSYVWKPEPLEMGMIHMKELNVIGSCRSNCYEMCLGLIGEGKLDTSKLVDVQLPLSRFEEAMNALRARKAEVFKAVLIPIP